MHGYVQENCLTLLFAAHDTTASALAMLLRYLKEQPAVLQQLRAEQQQVGIWMQCSLRPAWHISAAAAGTLLSSGLCRAESSLL